MKPLKGGTEEDVVLKCTHLTTNYVVKLFHNQAFGKNEIAWTRHASDLGIGPKLYYADPAGSYMIIEFAKGSSVVPTTAHLPATIKSIAASVAKLHNSKAPFARATDAFTRIETKYKQLQCSGPLEELIQNCYQQAKALQESLEHTAVGLAPCHNDLNPGNIFVHNNHVTLIDWGDAALGNPYYDIAAFFVLNITDAPLEQLFFENYDPKLLEASWQMYMQRCKQLVYFEFALNLLRGVQAGKSELLYKQAVPEVKDVSYYLTLLAERKTEIESLFLYNMAIASLTKMRSRDLDRYY